MIRKHKKDIILIGAFVAAGLIIGLILLLTGRQGLYVQVRVSGEVIETFDLNTETEYEIKGADGGKNLLIIKDHAAWIEEADCPDGLCKNMGKISLSGQSVICLPHEVVVEIVGEGKEDADVDVIVE